MFGRGSPRINLMQAASAHKKLSPRSSADMYKKRPSPKSLATEKRKEPKGGRANWNSGLEKGLVDILLEHNNECYKGQNGWSSEAWNRIVKLFNQKFPHVSFTKAQIQDKERELKRDYNALKEARKQSGVSWDERLCRIEAEEPIWANIILSNPKASKFWTKSFPLFELVGELHDGQTAEGTLNFTSIQPPPHPAAAPHPAAPHPAAPQPSQGAVTQTNSCHEEAEDGPAHSIQDDDDDNLTTLNQPPATTSWDKRGKRSASSRTGKDEGGHKRRQDGRVADMMGRFLEMKEKQAKAEEEGRARAKAEEEKRARIIANDDDFPIPTCIAVVDSMDELSDGEKVDAYDVFKDPQNRAIFMTAKDATRIKWLRKKIART